MIKKTDYKLIYTDMPAWTFLYVLAPLVYLFLSLLKLMPFNPVYLVIALVFGTILAFVVRHCKVVFDGRSRTIYWSKFGLFKRESGRCLFEQVKELAVDTIKDQESSDGRRYRLVLRLDTADIPLTDQYQTDIDSIKIKAEQIGEFTGIKIGQKMLSSQDKYKQIGQDDR